MNNEPRVGAARAGDYIAAELLSKPGTWALFPIVATDRMQVAVMIRTEAGVEIAPILHVSPRWYACAPGNFKRGALKALQFKSFDGLDAITEHLRGLRLDGVRYSSRTFKSEAA